MKFPALYKSESTRLLMMLTRKLIMERSSHSCASIYQNSPYLSQFIYANNPFLADK